MENSGFLTREKLLGVHKHKNFKLVVFIICSLLLADIVFLNYEIVFKKNPEARVAARQDGAVEKQFESSMAKPVDSCGDACKTEIKKAVSEGLTIQKAPSGKSIQASAKEYYIPLGAGYVSSSDWFDVPGLQASIDGSAYGKIKTSTFEVSVRVPTGNETAEVRLYNITAAHPVWNSNVMFTGGGNTQFLASSPISIDSGSNLYKVQMKTQLSYPAYIDQSRIHITTN